METFQDIMASLVGTLPKTAEEEMSAVEKLLRAFELHETDEKRFLRHYKEVLDKTKDPMITFLLQLIISDEEKHQAVVHAMAATLKGSLNWTTPKGAIPGGLAELDPESRQQLLRFTSEFLQEERNGIKEYEGLVRQSQDYYHGLFTLLIHTLLQDSRKHVMILEFLQQQLREA